MKNARVHIMMIITLTLTACAGSPLRADSVNGILDILTLGTWERTGLRAMVDLPLKEWPLTSDEVKKGVSALRKGFLGIGGAIAHLQQAIADNPCDPSAHAYLAIAYSYREAKARGAWDSAMQRQAARMRDYPNAGIGAAFPNATERFYDQLYESQVGSKLQPMRNSQSDLMARAVALKRGGVPGCAR